MLKKSFVLILIFAAVLTPAAPALGSPGASSARLEAQDRAEVVARLQMLGLTTAQAEERVRQLSEEEIQQLRAAPDSLQVAGHIGNPTTIIVVLLVVVGIVAIASIAS